MHNPSRRILRCAIVLAMGAASAAGLAQPAHAMTYSSAPLTTWTFTDSAAPGTGNVKPAGNAPIGTTVDDAGTRHTRRVYYTFDISAFRGQVIHLANLYTTEAEVTDCGTAAPVEIWRTTPVTDRSTWKKAPTELELVAQRTLGKGIICPRAYLGVDTAAFITAALARREKSITFEVRLAAAAEPDPRAWRSLQPLRLSTSTNYRPVVSDLRLRYPDRSCGTLAKHPTAGGITTFAATVTDTDSSPAQNTRFELWPVDRPDQRTPFGSTGGYGPQASTDLRSYPDGTVLAWSAQPSDYDDQGDWGRTCYLTIDNTAPAAAPAIIPRRYVETAYPGAGGPGVAGTFILDAQGDRDVVGFDYYEQQSSINTAVSANHPGGRARISVTPRWSGSDRIQARAVDAAGNRGPWQTYEFYVRDTAPRIEVTVGGVGLPSTIALYTAAAEVTSFGYTVDGGPETRVPAVDKRGTGPVVFPAKGNHTIVSRSYAGKKVIGSDTKVIYVDDAPGLASAEFLFPAEPILGDRGSFTFTPRTTGVVAYLVDFGDGDQERVPAAADGTATLPWTATTAGYFSLSVVSVTADGTRSSIASDQFWVIDTRPAIWSNAGACCPVTDGPGRPIMVSMASDLPGVTGFVYSFDGGPERSTTDGAAYTDVTVVPTHAGDSTFTARAVLADGTRSPANTITISITDAPLVTSAGPYGAAPVLDRPATFTLQPVTADVVSYRYYWGAFPDSTETVDAGTDGSATFTWTPQYAGFQELNVIAVARDGSESDRRQVYLSVDDPKVSYTGSWDQWGPNGGVGVPGQLGFFGGMLDVTVKYRWHVNDGPVHEVTPAEQALVTYVPYTPERNGENTVYVQREFTDGVLSPISEYRFLVGDQSLVRSADYPAGTWHGGPGVAGTFHLAGGRPGVVSFDYQFTDTGGTEAAAGNAPADAAGTADVTFSPPAATWYTLRVTGRTADGTETATTYYSFGVNPG
jgi:hypothetical protein